MTRRRREPARYSYSSLEPRQLLATTGLPQFDGDMSIDTGLIVNGGFDATEVADSTSQRVAISDVPGWSQSTGASETMSLVGFNDSPRGTGFHLDDQADVLESVFQDVNTETGQLYTLAFDLLGRPVADGADAASNDVNILWDGESVGTFRGITDFWQTFTVDVAGGTDDLTRLEIREVDGVGNDGVGAMMDNVRLVPVTNMVLENGSFEDNSSGTVDEESLPGWKVEAEDGERSADIHEGTGSDGTRFANLDRRDNSSDILYREVVTEPGGIYFVSFDLRSESGLVGEDEEARVRWNNQWVGTYRGTENWQSYGFTVRTDSALTRMVFREPGNAFTGDGDGPLLDNVRITKVMPSVSITLSDNSVFEFTENDNDLNIGSRINAISTNVVDSITGFTATLPDSADASEVLRVDGLNGIEQSVDGTLDFKADLTTAEFLTVLQTLQYSNSSDNPSAGTRLISVVVEAAGVNSPAATLRVNVSPVNDAPAVAAINDTTAVVGESLDVSATGTDVDGDTLTWTVSATGTAIEASDAQPTVDSDGNISWTPARNGEAQFTVRATDPGGLFAEQQFNVTVTQILDSASVLVNSGTDLPLFDSSAATDPAIGQTIADFEASTITGGTFRSVEPGVGRIYAVMAHWCPFCQQELPEIVEWLEQNDLGDDVEFVAISVQVDPQRDNYPVIDWFEREGFDETIIVDTPIPQARLMEIFGTRSFPFLVGVNDSGQVVDRFSGLSTPEQLDATLAAVRGQ